MATELTGKTAIVIGASSGMGRAITCSLATAGMRVMASARRGDRLLELQRELAAADRSIEFLAADVTSPHDAARVVDAAVSRFGGVDLLVYASGTNLPERSLKSLTHENWIRLLDTNLTGAFLCTQAVLPAMRKAGGGLIVYLSTAAVQRPDVSGVAYQASKHGLSGLAHGTRVEERDNGIRTSLIFPGLCNTEILLKRPTPTPPEVLDKALAPEDVADAVLFLARLPARALVPEMQLVPSRLW